MSNPPRPPAVAGTFYAASAADLAGDVARLLAAAPPGPPTQPKALIAPHAGYVYSGPIAARAYAPLAGWRERIRRVVLLGPTHRVAVDGLALSSASGFLTPLGTVPLDPAAAESLSGMPQVAINDPAHAAEHALEVQLPFLQTVLDAFTLIPLAVGRASPEAVGEVIARLWGGDETLIVVSSDLSHYLPYDAARETDARTAQKILGLGYPLHAMQACGATPINGLLFEAKRRKLHAELIDLRNSGDMAGDRSRVVGYGAFAFFERETHVH